MLRCVGRALTAILDLFKDIEGYQRFMLGFQPIQFVALRADVSRIQWMGEDIRNALVHDLAVLVAGEVWKAGKETQHFCLGRKASRGETLVGFPNNGIKRRVCCGTPPFRADRIAGD